LTNDLEELVSSPVHLPCGTEQDNPPHREDHEDSDKDGRGEGDEDYLHGWAPGKEDLRVRRQDWQRSLRL
jgi:hypothetical protein